MYYLLLALLLCCLSAERCKCNVNFNSISHNYDEIKNDICSLCLVKNCKYDITTISTVNLDNLIDMNITYYNSEQEYFFGAAFINNCIVLTVDVDITQYDDIVSSKIKIIHKMNHAMFTSHEIYDRYYKITRSGWKRLF